MIQDQLISSRREKSPFPFSQEPLLSQGGLVLTYCHCFGDDAGSGAL